MFRHANQVRANSPGQILHIRRKFEASYLCKVSVSNNSPQNVIIHLFKDIFKRVHFSSENLINIENSAFSFIAA